jgi:chemotaxis protein methyltransferase CheR
MHCRCPNMHKLPVTSTILEHELSQVRLLLERETGVLLDSSNEILSGALTELIESRRANSANDYIRTLNTSDTEREKLAESVMPTETRFFRYPAAFQTLAKVVIPDLETRKNEETPKGLRVWSAGCSTGQEPYSIAISLCEALKSAKSGWNLQIIASDIRANALREGERGLYHEGELQNLPIEILHAYFAKLGEHFLVKPRLRNLVTFTRGNLIKPDYIGRFDCIFCMDVLPHFSASQKMALLERLHLYLQPGGFLFLGQGEKLPAAKVAFHWIRHSDYIVYQRPAAAAAVSGR